MKKLLCVGALVLITCVVFATEEMVSENVFDQESQNLEASTMPVEKPIVTRENFAELFNGRTRALCLKGSQDVPVLIDSNNQLLSEVTKKTDKLDAVYIQNSLTQINQNTLGSSGLLNQINQNVLNNTVLIEEIAEGLACHNVINNSNVNPNGLMITEPGTYCFTEDVFFSPVVDGLSAIVVNADNVTIQMNDHILTNARTAANITGILVNGGQCDIVSGEIASFDRYGIRFNQGADLIVLTDLTVHDCGIATDAFGGISINQCTDIAVSDVICESNFFSGMAFFGCTRIQIINSSFINNVTGVIDFPPNGPQQEANGLFIGLGMPSSTPSSNIVITNCTASGNTSPGDAWGLQIAGTIGDVHNTDVTITSCFINGNSGSSASVLQLGEGVGIEGCDQIVIRSCSAQDNAGGNSNSYALVDCSNGVIEDCIAQRQTSFLTNGTANGFDLLASTRVTLTNCVALNISSIGGSGFGFFAGLIPFASYTVSDLIFSDCTAQDSTGSVTAAGFNLNSAIHCIIKNCTSISNGIGILMGDPGMPQVSYHNIINNNILTGNGNSGIVDETPTAFNAYYANFARNFPGLNYVGVPAATPIRTWVFPGTPSPTDNNMITPIMDVLDNIDVTG